MVYKPKSEVKQTAKSYDALASGYDETWEGYLENTHQKIYTRLSLLSTDHILDLSAGTGLLAEQLLNSGFEFEKFVLNDPSAKMLKVANKRVGESSKCSFSNHSADCLPHPSHSFDKIISLNAFHHYPNQPAVIREVVRLLKPGGTFYLLDWNREGIFQIVNFWIDQVTDQVITTVSLPEAIDLLKAYHFDITYQEQWWFSYWNLFLIECVKPEE